MQKATRQSVLTTLAFEQMDHVRRARGRMLDAAALGPSQVPCRIVPVAPGVQLRACAPTAADGPTLLLVPAPIKRHYIWDLAPHVSVVRAGLARGMRVYVVEWLPAGSSAAQGRGLQHHADHLLSAAVDAIAADSGSGAAPIAVAGHSLGGTLSAIFASLHPHRVRSLVLVEAPLHFADTAGRFARLVGSEVDALELANGRATIAGSFLNFVSSLAAPDEFQLRRYLDAAACAGDWQALQTHMRVERWMLDEFPMPTQLFVDTVELLYRGDCFMQGRLALAGRQLGPDDLTVPLLNIFDPRSEVIPADQILPFHDAAASPAKRLLAYEGDVGVAIQHVGALVGASAHQRIWPAVFDWLEAVGDRAGSH